MPYANYSAWPSWLRGPGSLSWRLTANTQIHTSPLDGSTQTLRLPGSRWVVTLSWQTMRQDDWRGLSSFIAYLGGRAGRFTMSPQHAKRRGAGGGSPVIDGAGQSGDVLATRGWPPNTAVLWPGDYISYPDAAGRPMLHQVVTGGQSDGAGRAWLVIAPPIRRPGADGEPIEIDAPIGLFRLASDEDGDLAVRAPLTGSLSVNLEEALV
ncbi:hypothetical protein HMPREF9946_02236 [Acetobacteraceae bacterium AT-5844]|nr:hypothetical protein HMPREF9946_02236 [Acetobacteraceae bacterium AT-5844]